VSTSEEDLVFVALCDRLRSTTNVHRTMSREELRQATGLDAEVLEETLKALRGPVEVEVQLTALRTEE
jgi:hypothetical protein